MKIKLLLALSASVLVMGCAAGGLTQEGGARAISQSAAQQAAQQHPQVVAEFGGAVGGTTGAYVTQVGRKVAAQTGIQGGGTGAYTITTLNSPVLNAFAVPGGYVYVTRQLLGLMDDEAELASVLGHEVGHIAADHSKQRQDRGLLTQLGALA
ncbi:MAG TPA: M48 family metalloprotease, partial [Allosphingosinicella sp.]